MKYVVGGKWNCFKSRLIELKDLLNLYYMYVYSHCCIFLQFHWPRAWEEPNWVLQAVILKVPAIHHYFRQFIAHDLIKNWWNVWKYIVMSQVPSAMLMESCSKRQIIGVVTCIQMCLSNLVGPVSIPLDVAIWIVMAWTGK